ncbi:MAG: hypothetical protein DRG55_00025 [Deltaproteobacteria bacterium]|nr:MAG: hypothetical protein DRG55_00025 [Deltaproteobacteria bacterium]
MRALVLLLLLSLLFPSLGRTEVMERVVGVIGGEVFTLSDLEEAAGHFGLVRPRAGNPFEERLRLEAFYREVWERLVEEEILERETKRIGIDVKDKEVEEVLEQLRKRHRLSPEEFSKELASQGFTLESYKHYLRTQMRKAKVVEAFIKPKISMDEEDLLAYYEEHKERYLVPLRVRVSHIFVALPRGSSKAEEERTHRKMERIVEALQQGHAFEEVASLYSEDPSAKYGGDMGYLSAKEMDPQLWEVISQMEVGEISPVVRSSMGLHILKLTERQGERPLPFEAVRKRVMEDYYKEEVQRRYRQWLKEAKKRVGVQSKI